MAQHSDFVLRLFKFWDEEMSKDPKVYHVNGELNLTLMAEDAINELHITEDIEEEVFEATVDFEKTLKLF